MSRDVSAKRAGVRAPQGSSHSADCVAWHNRLAVMWQERKLCSCLCSHGADKAERAPYVVYIYSYVNRLFSTAAR